MGIISFSGFPKWMCLAMDWQVYIWYPSPRMSTCWMWGCWVLEIAWLLPLSYLGFLFIYRVPTRFHLKVHKHWLNFCLWWSIFVCLYICNIFALLPHILIFVLIYRQLLCLWSPYMLMLMRKVRWKNFLWWHSRDVYGCRLLLWP